MKFGKSNIFPPFRYQYKSFVMFKNEAPERILVNNQLDTLFFQRIYLIIYFPSLHVSSNPVLIISRIERYQYIIWYMSLCVGDCLVCWSGPAYQAVTYTK